MGAGGGDQKFITDLAAARERYRPLAPYLKEEWQALEAAYPHCHCALLCCVPCCAHCLADESDVSATTTNDGLPKRVSCPAHVRYTHLVGEHDPTQGVGGTTRGGTVTSPSLAPFRRCLLLVCVSLLFGFDWTSVDGSLVCCIAAAAAAAAAAARRRRRRPGERSTDASQSKGTAPSGRGGASGLVRAHGGAFGGGSLAPLLLILVLLALGRFLPFF